MTEWNRYNDMNWKEKHQGEATYLKKGFPL